ncbi:FMN-binding glutamate synthase family protein [Alloalcanivorax mobilis]|uniref:FMN-binding glutamate synthase family protein n=1 Tax=Alloalcanivorax mobilis TaxID=2019569 RepID=UPI000B5B478E|nr:FMN-binding glutamate synthase family protein [Alloalcanivorax mobilis]ASK34351.1 FMN-binding glutamate synthase family protein [Alcanivorax sp. N3-2A]
MSGTTSGLARFGSLLAAIALALITSTALVLHPHIGWLWPLAGVLWLLAGLGVWDLFQHRHTLMRNYPLLAHFRWMFEFLRPFLRQYIVENDREGRPYNRDERSLIYQRAKNAVDAKPFGTDLNVYDGDYQMVTHSMAPRPKANADFRVRVGGAACTQPYDVSLLNVSAMSFGSLSAPAIEALNLGARQGGFYHDTGEGGVSPYHTRHGGDLVWEIGSGYFGCRDDQGRFDRELFKKQARQDQVKMIEIKLSQGAKPGHGGVLPAAKITREIADTRKIPMREDCVSPAYHTAFSTPRELIEFAASLREDAGGKPVGVKLCVGHPWEVLALCKAMLETGLRLDFIVVDGAEGGTGAAPEEFSDHIGMPLREGLLFVRNALVATGLRGEIRLAASGKVYSAYTLAANLALGADWCNAARAFMLSLGCVQTKNCHTDRCPTGVATQNPSRQRGLVVADKAPRVRNFHFHTLEHLAELIAAAGLDHPGELHPHHLFHRHSATEMVTLDKLYPFLAPDSLLTDADATPYADWWHAADPDSFKPRHTVGPSHHKSELVTPH